VLKNALKTTKRNKKQTKNNKEAKKKNMAKLNKTTNIQR
jgi:hypothetical protein